MRLLCVTDLHGSHPALGRILTATGGAADMVLLGGDITNFGTPADLESIVGEILERDLPLLAVAGNCDSATIDRRLDELGVGLHGRGRLTGSVGFQGLSAIPPWRQRMYQLTEEELTAALETGYREIEGAAVHVVLSHVPPHGLALDRTFLFMHAGSRALRHFVDARRPAAVFCGHIHEGRGVERLGETVVVNCGAGRAGHYALAEVGSGEPQVTLCRA